MLDKSHVLKGEKCHGGKLSRERLTILLAVNSDKTEKLPSLGIWKSLEPRCFKNIKSLLCDYKNQRRVWTTAKLFHAWLLDLDKTIIRKNWKFLWFIDNCPIQPKNVQLQNVKVEFLLPKATSKLQPLDQGIIKVLKQYYHKRLVLQLTAQIDKPEKMFQFYYSIPWIFWHQLGKWYWHAQLLIVSEKLVCRHQRLMKMRTSTYKLLMITTGS